MKAVDALPWATILCIIFAIVGGAVVVQGHLSFKEYIESMTVAIGLLAVGRGLAKRTS